MFNNPCPIDRYQFVQPNIGMLESTNGRFAVVEDIFASGIE